MTISPSILCKTKNISDKSSRENQNTFYIQETFSENRSVYEIMWKNIGQPDRPQMIIWRMRFPCWITKATDIHSEYVILNVFLLQKCLREGASILRLWVHCRSC